MVMFRIGQNRETPISRDYSDSPKLVETGAKYYYIR